MVTSPFSFRTRLTAEEAQKHTQVMVDTIKTPILHAGVGTAVNLSTVFPLNTVTNPYPVIIIINGAGKAGKDTFSSMVSEYSGGNAITLSTVDPLRKIVDTLIATHVDNYIDLYTNPPMTSAQHAEEKSDLWRSLMHDVKTAWHNMDDGPNIYCLGEIVRLITDPTVVMPEIIFVNIREKDNIESFKQYCYSMGLICFSLLIDGTVDAATITNDGDRLVNEITYDLVVQNKSSLDDLSITAFIFHKFIKRANHMYGVNVNDVVEEPVEEPPNAVPDDQPETVPDVKEEKSESSASFLHNNDDPNSAGTVKHQLQGEDHNRADTGGGNSNPTGNQEASNSF